MDKTQTNQNRCTIYSLRPSWSRILDRVHTLGQTKRIYTNSLATLEEQGDYPRLMTSADETKSFTLDGKHQWITKNWTKGWAVVNDSLRQATLYFAGNNGEIFHQIDLTTSSHWDCFECLLQMFSTDVKQDQQPSSFQQMIQQTIVKPALSANLANIAKKVNREIIRGVKLSYTLNTTGGLIKRYHELGSLMTKFGTVALSSAKSRVLLNPAMIKCIDISGKNSPFKGTFFDINDCPRLIIEAT